MTREDAIARPSQAPQAPAEPTADAGTDADPPWMRGLYTNTGYLLHRLGLRSGQLFNAQLLESGLRLRHYALIRYLATLPGAPQRELSERLGYDPSAIVSLVDDLERLDLAERRPSPTDRRRRIVVLTDRGRDLLSRTDDSSHRVTDELLAPLTTEERSVLHALLLRLTEADRAPEKA